MRFTFVAFQGAANMLERLGDIICVGLRGFSVQWRFIWCEWGFSFSCLLPDFVAGHMSGVQSLVSEVFIALTDWALLPLNSVALKKRSHDCLQPFRTGELFIMTAISISSKLYCMVLFWVFCFPKYVCKWKGKSCLKGRITQALYQRKESWRYIDAAPVHSSSVAFVISQHLLELCYTMENLSAVTLCGYSFTFSSNYFILLYSCCL